MADEEDIKAQHDGRNHAPVHIAKAIPEVTIPQENRQLRFSFRHLECTHQKFNIDVCSAEFFKFLLQSIRDYSTWMVDDFREQNNNERRHVIDFPKTSEPNGFTSLDADQLAIHEAWQFQLCKKEDWRVHGILIDDTFYVVWLDVNHALYPKSTQCQDTT
jgi:hypothetical protein